MRHSILWSEWCAHSTWHVVQDAAGIVKRWEITRGAVIEDFGKVRSCFVTSFEVVEYVISWDIPLDGVWFWSYHREVWEIWVYTFKFVTGRCEELRWEYLLQVNFEEKEKELFEMVCLLLSLFRSEFFWWIFPVDNSLFFIKVRLIVDYIGFDTGECASMVYYGHEIREHVRASWYTSVFLSRNVRCRFARPWCFWRT
jgi:hypothetical protein